MILFGARVKTVHESRRAHHLPCFILGEEEGLHTLIVFLKTHTTLLGFVDANIKKVGPCQGTAAVMTSVDTCTATDQLRQAYKNVLLQINDDLKEALRRLRRCCTGCISKQDAGTITTFSFFRA